MSGVRESGFTLLELQVAMVLLIMGLYGMSRTLVSMLGQMRVLEGSNALYSYLPADASKIIISELIYPGAPSVITEKIHAVESIHVYASSMTALVTPEQVY